MLKLSRYGVVIQSRMSSSRLPGKALADIDGTPMLLWQLKRLKKGLKVPKLIVATSDHSSDDPIEQLCTKHEFQCFRGPLDDVMLRFIGCGKRFDLDYIIRVGGDDPLIDPECCNRLMDLHREDPCDFIYASHRRGWPYGCAAELISRDALERIHRRTSDATYREHTIPYFFDHPDDFRIRKCIAPPEISRPEYFFTVDYREDLELVREIVGRLRKEGDYFPLRSVIRLVDRNQELRDINRELHSGFDD